MSLLFDALKNASARKASTLEETEPSNADNQHKATSQKLAGNLLNTSTKKSQVGIDKPLLITALLFVTVISGVYWWNLLDSDPEIALESERSLASADLRAPKIEENLPQAKQDLSPTSSAEIKAALEIENLTSLVDQMQNDQELLIINAEREKKKLESELLVKIKSLTNSEQRVALLDTRIGDLKIERDTLNTKLNETRGAQTQMQRKYSLEITSLKSKQEKLTTTLSGVTGTLSTSEKRIEALNKLISDERVSSKQQISDLSQELATQKQFQRRQEELNIRLTEELTVRDKTLSATTTALSKTKQNIIKLNAQIKNREKEKIDLNTKLNEAQSTQENLLQQYEQEKIVAAQKLSALTTALADSSRNADLAQVQHDSLSMKNTSLLKQVSLLNKKNKQLKALQSQASANIAKIQKVQDTLFLNLQNNHNATLKEILAKDLQIASLSSKLNQKQEEYLVLQNTLNKKTLEAKPTSPSKSITFITKSAKTDEGISLRLDTQLGD